MKDSWKDWPRGYWSHSRFSELRRCPKSHDLRYNQKVYPKGSRPDALEIGGYVHDVCEYVGKQCLSGFEPTDYVWQEAEAQARDGLQNPKNMIDGARLISAYRMQYGDEQAGWPPDEYELIGVEEVFKARELHQSIGGFASKADVTLRQYGSGRLVVAERKTGARKPSGSMEEIVESLRSRPQLMALAFCARDHYGELPLIIHDLITKTKTVEFYRIEVEVTDADLDRWAREQVELEQMIPLTCANRDACDPPVGFRCQYFKFCHGTDQDRQALYEIKTKR